MPRSQHYSRHMIASAIQAHYAESGGKAATVADIARRLGCSVRTVRTVIDAGDPPGTTETHVYQLRRSPFGTTVRYRVRAWAPTGE